MAVWEQLINMLKEDYDRLGMSSRLCCWMKEEKRQDFRLALRIRRMALQDTPESRREFGIFLLRSLLEEPRLRPLQSRLASLPSLSDQSTGPEPKAGKAGQLRNLLERLERGETDLPRALLLTLAEEVLEHFPGSAERTDAYVELQACFLDMAQGRIGETDYLRSALNLLLKRERMGLDAASRKFLEDYGAAAGGNGFFDGAKRKAEKYRRLLELLDRPGLPAMDRAGLAHLHEDILAILLAKEVRSFFYDSGMAAGNASVGDESTGGETTDKKSGRGNPAMGKPVRRRKDRMVDLMDYCQENGLFPFGNQQVHLSEETLAEYEAFFENLQKTGNHRALVPVCLDQVSGAGLYIVGQDWFPEQYQDPSLFHRKCCCYACIRFGDLVVEKDSLSFIWYPERKEFGFPTLKEAQDWYINQCLPGALGDIYRENNGAPPPGCPAELRCYFSGADDFSDIDLAVTSEDRERAEREFDRDCAAREERARRRM